MNSEACLRSIELVDEWTIDNFGDYFNTQNNDIISIKKDLFVFSEHENKSYYLKLKFTRTESSYISIFLYSRDDIAEIDKFELFLKNNDKTCRLPERSEKVNGELWGIDEISASDLYDKYSEFLLPNDELTLRCRLQKRNVSKISYTKYFIDDFENKWRFKRNLNTQSESLTHMPVCRQKRHEIPLDISELAIGNYAANIESFIPDKNEQIKLDFKIFRGDSEVILIITASCEIKLDIQIGICAGDWQKTVFEKAILKPELKIPFKLENFKASNREFLKNLKLKLKINIFGNPVTTEKRNSLFQSIYLSASLTKKFFGLNLLKQIRLLTDTKLLFNDGSVLHAHSEILIDQSPVFANEFYHMIKMSKYEFRITDIDFETGKMLLHFIYTEKIPSNCKIVDFIFACLKYGLLNEAFEKIPMNSKNAVQILIAANIRNNKIMKKETIDYLGLEINFYETLKTKTDLVFQCKDGERAWAHINILSKVTAVFKGFCDFKSKNSNGKTLRILEYSLPRVQKETFEVFLQCIYNEFYGIEFSTFEYAKELLPLFDMYIITHLKSKCVDDLSRQINWHTIPDLLDLRKFDDTGTLTDKIANYINENPTQSFMDRYIYNIDRSDNESTRPPIHCHCEPHQSSCITLTFINGIQLRYPEEFLSVKLSDSQWFSENVVKMKNSEKDKLSVGDAHSETFLCYLEFLESDQIIKSFAVAEELLFAAHYFMDIKLKAKCENYLADKIVFETAIELFLVGHHAHSVAIKANAMNYICHYAHEMVLRDDYQNLVKHMPELGKDIAENFNRKFKNIRRRFKKLLKKKLSSDQDIYHLLIEEKTYIRNRKLKANARLLIYKYAVEITITDEFQGLLETRKDLKTKFNSICDFNFLKKFIKKFSLSELKKVINSNDTGISELEFTKLMKKQLQLQLLNNEYISVL